MRRGSTEVVKAADDGVERRVLLLTSTSLELPGVGSLFLRDQIEGLPEIVFTTHVEPAFLIGGRSGPTLRRIVQLARAAAGRMSWFTGLRLRWFRSAVLRKRVEAVAAAARQARIQCIWATASSPEIIWIAEELAALGFDLRVTVWDAPEYFSANLHLDRRLHDLLMQGFSRLLRAANAVSVMGHAMQTRFLEQYGVDSEVLRHGIDLTAPADGRAPLPGEAIRIAFAGSLYSKREWNSFVAALDAVDWRVNDHAVSLHFIGRFPLSGVRRPKRAHFLGEKPFAETIQTLSTMHVGYLPYWFDKEHELVARTSFPGKLSAYAAAGVAVFHHAPSYTEATEFLRRFRFGVACASLDPKEIIASLRQLLDLAATETCREARAQAFRQELSRAAMATRARKLLGGIR